MRGAGERQVYVPRGRRLINEQKQKEDEANEQRLREEQRQEQQQRQSRAVAETAAQAEARAETETLLKDMTLEKKTEPTKNETNGTGGPQQRQIYVPPGRRLAQQQQEQERASRGGDEEDSSNSPLVVRRDMKAWTTEREKERERDREATSTQTSSSSSSSSAPVPAYKHFIDDDRLANRVLLLLDLPSDLSESRRSALTQPYLENSAACRWLSPTDCMIVFASESACQRVCAQQSSATSSRGTINSTSALLYAPIAIAATKFCTRDYLQIARELYDAIPAAERDSRVANRMIGAALGIRVAPRSSTTSSSSSTSAASSALPNVRGSGENAGSSSSAGAGTAGRSSDSSSNSLHSGLNSSASVAKKRRVEEVSVLSDAWDD